MLFQLSLTFFLSSEFGPLSSQANAAGTAYPITTESGKLEEELRLQKPVPAHVAALFTQSIEPLKVRQRKEDFLFSFF